MDDLLIIETMVDEGRIGMVRLAGHMFLPDTPAVMSALGRALTTTPHAVAVCDLSGLGTPLSDLVLTSFPAALRRCGGWPQASLHLAAPGRELAARLAHLRMRRYLPVHSSIDEALTVAELEIGREPLRLDLGPDPASLRAARDAVRSLWPAHGGLGRDEAVLVTNELAANAIRHVAEPFTVSLAVGHSRMLVAVTDPSREEPILRPSRAVSETHGRGMQVVAGLSLDWGVRLVHPEGKTVWATLPVPTSAVPRSRSPMHA